MTMMNGLNSIDLDMMDEEFFGPPPRFLVEGHDGDAEIASHDGDAGVFAGLDKIRQLMGAW
jgi:hypothetical protein